ncbi:MAG TPA: hypothetical protein VFK84_02290 [Burkholderiales bacterium]|nr:hypothetical protein [Burkholderiales bacterium]
MDTCTVEVGLLKKHPCGANAVTKCANCEQPLCTKHGAPRMSGGKKIFLCPECNRAWKESEKLGEIPSTPAAAPVATPPAPGSKKPAEAPKPAAAAPKPAAAAKPAAAKPAEKKPEPPEEHSGALEFTPSKPAETKPTPPPAPAPKPAAKKPEPPKAGELSLEDSAPPEDKK